ncbi:acyl carrier protein [Alkalibacterium putridalgicola]|uniref:Acyl carrier protein n=1 Tax=Alkalibacterium putridalgicola TaxID=426703 RepID=A0A1H7Q0C4_9LACT|nr:acyl carrier protein [Alkalibacterium putridalgicola]GEK88106.1 acyl carrier protein [Alkalibacterium putridalgicola]SEL40737.1 acyl carrier protein [Alkalibacterium putridalgicola]
MTTFEQIQEIIVDQLDKEESEVQLDTNFRDELEADSLDLFQIINDIEDEFDIKIESEEGLNTVKDLVDYVEKQKEAK